MPAAKHLDPVMGVDTHIILIPTPAGPVPTPLPHPYIGMLLDPMDYIPKLGTAIRVNGVPRAVAGTAGVALPPHIPMGGPFLKPPSNESEMFMGSMTVNADGAPMSFAALPVLSCQDVGMPAPPRPKKKSVAKSLMLPVTVVMPIPAGPLVMVGGPPTILKPGLEALIAPLGKGLFKALRALAKKSKRLARKIKAISDRLHKIAGKVLDKLKIKPGSLARNKVHRAICSVTGHPVDIATGKLFTDFIDLEIPGPLPFTLERVWFSTSTYDGPFGHGWHHSYDLAVATSDKAIGVRLADGRVALFPPIKLGAAHYDSKERLTLHRDHWGYALRGTDGMVFRFAELAGRAEHVLASVQDRNGHGLRFVHDERGRLARIFDSGGRYFDLVSDSSGRIVEVQGPQPLDPAQRCVLARYAYDGHGNLAEVRDAEGGAQRFSYQRHLLARETNKNGLSFYFEYDGLDSQARCIRTWGDGGIYNHQLRYDPDANVTLVQNSLGHVTTYHHDGSMVHKVIDPLGHQTATEYDENYRVVAEIDALGQRSVSRYDTRGNLTQAIGPDGAKVELEYGPHDQPSRVIDSVGGEWQWQRDEQGRVIERKDPLGRVTLLQYQGPWLVSVTDPAGGHTAIGYDPNGNVHAIAAPDGATTHYRHDGLGRLVSITDPKANAQRRELDLMGRAVRVHEPDGNLRELAYDPEGNVVHAKDAHHDVRFTYAGMGRLTSRSEAGTTVRFEYDTEERLVAIANEHGHVYRFVLSPTGEVSEEHGFDGLMRRYSRDANARVLRVDRPDARFSEYKLDPAGRAIEVKHSDESVERYAYRLDGELLAASNKACALVFERDVLGRIVKEHQGEHWVASEYNPLGLRTRMLSSLGANQLVERNLMGDVTRVDEASAGFEARFVRDQLGLEIERALPGGIKSRWQRDNVGRPLQHTVSGDEATLRAVGYKWEPNDRLRAVIDGLKGATQYGHDALGNLAWAQYSDGTADLRMPDAVGNLFRREDRGDRRYGPAGQLLAQSTVAGEITYAYDPEGNLIEKCESNGAVWRYAWNGAGMLAKVVRPDGTEVTFDYDALGRRIKKSYRGQHTHWIWDGNNPLHEWVEGKLAPERVPEVPFIWSADPGVKKREAELNALLSQGPPERGGKGKPITWLFEPESFAPMAKLVGGEQFSIVTDHLGTPVLMTNGAGVSVWSASISAYGELRELEGERHACPFRWPGQYEDAETGLYYNRFRYYDAGAGQYASQDPLGLRGGDAQCGYVHDPLVWADPLGLAACGPGNAAERLPRTQGMSVGRAERTLKEHGFVRTKVSNSPARNQTWKHADGSEVRIHPYGDVKKGPFRSGNNAHIHKEDPLGNQLTDRGLVSTNKDETHIGLRNPTDLPQVRGRPHGS